MFNNLLPHHWNFFSAEQMHVKIVYFSPLFGRKTQKWVLDKANKKSMETNDVKIFLNNELYMFTSTTSFFKIFQSIPQQIKNSTPPGVFTANVSNSTRALTY